jgi:hypothetical protein
LWLSARNRNLNSKSTGLSFSTCIRHYNTILALGQFHIAFDVCSARADAHAVACRGSWNTPARSDSLRVKRASSRCRVSPMCGALQTGSARWHAAWQRRHRLARPYAWGAIETRLLMTRFTPACGPGVRRHGAVQKRGGRRTRVAAHGDRVGGNVRNDSYAGFDIASLAAPVARAQLTCLEPITLIVVRHASRGLWH